MVHTSNHSPGASGHNSKSSISLEDFLKTRCMASTHDLEKDPQMFLLKRDQYTDAIATEMTAKYLSFVDLTPDHQCNAYRGFRTDLAGLNTVLREGLVQSRKFHFMVSFAKELDIAVYYSFRPHQCSIQPDQKALAVLVQIDVSKAQAAGIRITEEHTMKRVWDVWGNIPPQHLKRIFVFDVIAHKFVEIKSADQRF